MVRLDKLPSMKTQAALIDASRYNRVRLALLRVGIPLRLELPNLRDMDLVLDKRLWVCIDRTLQDYPVVAWTHFDNAVRTSLHEPVPCKLQYFHPHANLIVDTVLRTMDKLLTARLAQFTENRQFPLRSLRRLD